MGICIAVLGIEVPRLLRTTFICDGVHVWPPTVQTFEHASGYVGQYAAAMKAGWKATAAGGCRVFYGPCCSGKVTAELSE